MIVTASPIRLYRLRLVVEDGTVRLDRAAEVRATVRDDREARRPCPSAPLFRM